MAAVEALLMDFGGVLTTPGRAHLDVFCQEEDIDETQLKGFLGRCYRAPTDDDPLALLETGRLSLADFETTMAQRLSARFGRPISPRGLAARLQGDLSIEWPMVREVHRLREAGVATAMVSNSWSDDQYPEAVLAAFDVVVLSRHVGVRKPDRQFLDLALGRLATRPETCVFVDDIGVNCEVAASLGMQVLHHREPAQTLAALAAAFGR